MYASRGGQSNAYTLQSYQYVGGQNPGFQLAVEYVDFDGINFGKRCCQLLLPRFPGAKPIANMSAFSLAMHSDAAGITGMLTTRGRVWESLAGQNFRHYKGVAMDDRGDRYNIDGRIMIDTATHHRINANSAFRVAAFPKTGGGKRKRPSDIDDYDDEWDVVVSDVTTGTLAPLTGEKCLLVLAHGSRLFLHREEVPGLSCSECVGH